MCRNAKLHRSASAPVIFFFPKGKGNYTISEYESLANTIERIM